MRKLGPSEFIDTALEPVVPADDQRAPDPSAVAAMQRLALAMGGPHMLTDSPAFRRLHEELTRVERRDGSVRVVTATQRPKQGFSGGVAPIPTSSSTFKLVRDWDPED